MPKTPQEILEENELERDVEFIELIKFSREIYKDNLELTKENENLKTKKKRSKLAEWLFSRPCDTADKMWGLGAGFGLFLALLLTLYIIGTASFNHRATGNFYLARCEFSHKTVGTTIKQEVDWGKDIQVGDCMETYSEALEQLCLIESSKND